MTVVWALVALGWRRLGRDRLGLLFTFLAPVAVASVMVGIYTSQDPSDGIPVGVIVDEDGDVGRDLLRRLEGNPMLDVHRYSERAAIERAVRRRDVAAGVVVPVAVDEAAEADEEDTGEPALVELIGPPEIAMPGGVRAAVESAVAETAAVAQLGRALVPEGDGTSALRAGFVALGPGHDDVDVRPAGDGAWRGATEAAVLGTLVLFVMMNTMAASSALAEYRELGILARARTTRASPRTIALGFGLGLASFALLEAVLVLMTGWLLFGIDWASWSGVLLVVMVLTPAAGGLGVVTGSLLPSPELGATVAGPAGFLLGMLGGCLWPLEIVGPLLDRLGHLTPHAWAVEALQVTGIGGGGLDDVATQLGVVLAMAAVLLVVGGWRVARMAARA